MLSLQIIQVVIEDNIAIKVIGNRSQVQDPTFWVWDNDGIITEALAKNVQLSQKSQLDTKFWIRTDVFLRDMHPKYSPGTRTEP